MTSTNIDADEVYPGLWQGSRPPQGTQLRDAGFQVLVLCAYEHQPQADWFDGIEVIHAPNLDIFDFNPSRKNLDIANKASTQVVAALQKNRRVLVTCYAGINRSGFVVALALHKFLGVSGLDACSMIKRARPYALTNPKFVATLAKLPSKPGLASQAFR